MLKRLVKYAVTANVSSEHYQLTKDDMYKNNVMMLRLLSTIAVSIFVLCSVLGLTIQNMHSKLITYVVGMAFSVAVLTQTATGVTAMYAIRAMNSKSFRKVFRQWRRTRRGILPR